MAGNLGSLGGVSYDIVSVDKTSEALDSARSGFVVTAGDIIAEISKVDAKFQEFAKTNAVVTGSSERVSIISGLNADAIKNLGIKYADAATPISEVLQIEEYLAKQHVTSIEQMDQLIPRIDTFGEANRTNAVELMGNLTPALKNYNISALDTTRYMEPLTYLFSQTGLNAGLYGSEMRRTAPILSQMNVSFEDSNALLLTAYNRYGDGRTAMTMLTKASADAEKQHLTGGAALAFITSEMGLSTDSVNKNRDTIQNHIPTMDRLAEAQRGTFTTTENLNELVKNLTLSFGGLSEAVAAVSGPISMVGQSFMGLAVLGTVFPSIGASITAGLGSIGGSLTAAGTAIAGSVTAGIGIGIVVGLAGVWVLLKTGILDGIAQLGADLRSSGAAPIMAALQVILAPIGSLGAGIIAIVRGDFASIPSVMAAPFQQAATNIVSALNSMRSAAAGIGPAFQSGFAGVVGAVGSAFSGVGSAFNAMAGQIQGIFRSLIAAASSMISSAVSGFYSLGMNLMVSLANGLVAGASSIPNAIGGLFSGIKGALGLRAAGGPVSGGESYIVGEKGPELFTPSSGGNITPNNALGGGGGGDTYYVTVNASKDYPIDQIMKDITKLQAGRRAQRGYRS